MVTFKIGQHSRLPDMEIVEILVDDSVIGVIYPHEEKGIKLVSAHVDNVAAASDFSGEVVIDDSSSGLTPIPAVLVSFEPRPYRIVDGRMVRLPNDPRTS